MPTKHHIHVDVDGKLRRRLLENCVLSGTVIPRRLHGPQNMSRAVCVDGVAEPSESQDHEVRPRRCDEGRFDAVVKNSAKCSCPTSSAPVLAHQSMLRSLARFRSVRSCLSAWKRDFRASLHSSGRQSGLVSSRDSFVPFTSSLRRNSQRSRAFFEQIRSTTTATESTMAEKAPTPTPITWELLQQQNAATSSAIIAALDGDEDFLIASEAQAKAIRTRDEEDDEKLAKGIKAAIAKKVLPADLKPEPYKEIDVLGKTPDQVAQAIIKDVGEAANTGCVIVMCGLSGTGKGTTVARLKQLLPNAQTWSNGNIFRSLTLLCARWCAKEAENWNRPVSIQEALTPENLSSFMKCLSFGKFAADGGFDTRIHSEDLDVDELVGNVQNTLLKGREVGSNIPTVAEQTQGEVIAFVSGALKQLADAGKIVLLEGRAQTVDFVRTPYRYTLTLSDPVLVGKRRVAQVAAAAALKKLSAKEGVAENPPTAEEITAEVRSALQIFKE